MQYVNNDNEDIFRSAAEGYSLSTRGMDWEKMKARMAEPERPSAAERKRAGIIVPVILLLVAALPWLQLQQDRVTGHGVRNTAFVSAMKVNPEKKEIAALDQPLNSIPYITVPKAVALPLQRSENIFANEEPPAIHDVEVNNTTTAVEARQLNIMAVGFPKAFQPAFPTARKSGMAFMNPVAHPAKPTHEKTLQRFYVVAEGGLDRTMVDFQSARKTGKQYGLLLGYDISKKLSVEAGVLMDRKYYYTEGSYLSKDRIYLPPNSKILEASGDCNMFEVPVLLRFRPFNRLSNLSFSAGAVSYIMRRESYDYLYYYGNSGTSAVHSWTYNNSGTNLVAATQVSAAYDMPVTSHLRIRVEPYVNIPVQGMGYSKLKLMSTGLHVGIVQHIP